MIHAREAREIMDNALKGMYKEVVGDIGKDIVRRSEDGYTMTTCHMAPDVFERYEDELLTLLKELGYHVSKPSKSSAIVYFVISWKEESPFYEDQPDQPEQPKWWEFWK